MVLTTSTPNEINFRSLRKRKRNNSLYSSFFNDNRVLQAVDEVTEHDNKENKNVLTDCTTNDGPNRECNFNNNTESLINDDVKVKEEDLTIQNTEIKSDCNDDGHRSRITVCKIEDLRADPTRHNEESVEITDVKTENNPQISTPSNLDTNLENWLSEDIKTENEEHQMDKRPNSNDDTPSKQKRRRLSSDISNYDQLSERLKTELCNNEFEHIDMLHDLSSVINFGESKLDADNFCSTTNNAMETEEDTVKTVEPEVDPLLIHENETIDSVKVQEINSEDTKNVDNDDTEMNDYIKEILGELDIELSEEEEAENEEPQEEEHWEENKIEESDESCSDELSENALKELYNIKIKLMHEVPPQHKVEHTAGTKSLTKSQKKLFLRHGPMKTGQYTPKEDKIIIKNWHTFCETHNWNPKCTKPFTKMKYGTKFYIKSQKERRKFIQFLANGLPWRTLQSIYRRFRHLHAGYNPKSRYSTADDEKILNYVKKTSRHDVFVRLSSILHRPKDAICKRYRRIKQNLKNKKSTKSEVKWTLQSIGKFINTFMDVTLNESVEDLKDASIPLSVWRKLEKKLNIDSNALHHFWMNQLHMQLFSPEPIYLNDIRIKLIEYVYGKGISSTREIVWSNVAKYFDGVTTFFLCRTFLYLVRDAIFKLHTKHFPDIIEYLYNKKIKLIMSEETDKFLPRLIYRKGKVKIKDEDP
ncbi:transcription termination factor 1-like [Ceratina calcarata]|uniref:Transcription termination factor 1-like n=1 Tax=Ceratina calcarata TaxID=156304 RepID=A0AAJ7ISF1_9HYME|nr:transcription termination factor 1-like [Ceratina calcarata]